MRTFAPKQNKKALSSSLTRPHTLAPGLQHLPDHILHLPRTMRNQTVQQLPQQQTEPDDHEASYGTKEVTCFAHDFSQIPVTPKSPASIQAQLTINRPGDTYEQEADRVSEQVMQLPVPQLQGACTYGGGRPKGQTEQVSQKHERWQVKRNGWHDLGQATVPPIVHEVLHSAEQPLDPATRLFMESRFGHDFSQVRVHTDASAARSASAIEARAYTIGSDVVFADGQFQPTIADGQRLLAHELAHVVQQSHRAASIQRAPKRASREGGDFRCGGDLCTTQTQNNTYPTWAGKFIVDKYCVTQSEDEGGNGVDLTMRFNPNDHVDAEKIAFVQTAQTKTGGKPVSIYEEKGAKEKATSRQRMIPEGKTGEGTHIDQPPASRTPLMGMRDVSGKSGLADFELSTPPALSTPGWHYMDNGKLKHQDASMHDCPSLPRESPVAQQQLLETAALAIAGAQKGIYYGSVQWGWKMGPKDTVATGFPIQVVSKDAPSSVFSEAAKLWTQGSTSEGKPTIPLPQSMYAVAANSADLWDDPGKRKKIGNLTKGTRVGVTEKSDPKHADWRNVVVVSGPQAAKVGWVRQADIKQFPGPALPAP